MENAVLTGQDLGFLEPERTLKNPSYKIMNLEYKAKFKLQFHGKLAGSKTDHYFAQAKHSSRESHQQSSQERKNFRAMEGLALLPLISTGIGADTQCHLMNWAPPVYIHMGHSSQGM